MEGIVHSNFVNTVSPTYAKEILTAEYGASLNPVLQALEGKICGILNGIDYTVWNPETDPFITPYSIDTLSEGKKKNKETLQKQLGLSNNTSSMLASYVGRIDSKQKGIDLLIEALKAGALGTPQRQFVFLGTGETYFEDILTELSVSNPSFTAVCRFDVNLSHSLYAASDVIVMPSKYEPCGLVQMIAMRYGAIPVVRKTGGLADTVTEGKTGFLFTNYSTEELIFTLNRAWSIIENDEKRLQMAKLGMEIDFSWDGSATKYQQLYRTLLWNSL